MPMQNVKSHSPNPTAMKLIYAMIMLILAVGAAQGADAFAKLGEPRAHPLESGKLGTGKSFQADHEKRAADLATMRGQCDRKIPTPGDQAELAHGSTPRVGAWSAAGWRRRE